MSNIPNDAWLADGAVVEAILAPHRASSEEIARAYKIHVDNVRDIARYLGVPFESGSTYALGDAKVRRVLRHASGDKSAREIALAAGTSQSYVQKVLEAAPTILPGDHFANLRARPPSEQDNQPVLDHGYIRLVEVWGTDAQIVAAARMSTGKGFRGWGPFFRCANCGAFWRRQTTDRELVPVDPNNLGCDYCDCDNPRFEGCKKCHGDGACTECMGYRWKLYPGDEKLLSYLYRNKHTTPFEMAGATFEIKLPIFVARQWMRHRTQSYNEMSARYVALPEENYLPDPERICSASTTNKQASTLEDRPVIDLDGAEHFRDRLAKFYAQIDQFYREALNAGVSKELARVIIPVGRYTVMRASANLHNWLRFLRLRNDSHAQAEIRLYAQALQRILRSHFPRTIGLFERYR